VAAVTGMMIVDNPDDDRPLTICLSASYAKTLREEDNLLLIGSLRTFLLIVVYRGKLITDNGVLKNVLAPLKSTNMLNILFISKNH
jgi:hypothetical protein